MNRSLAAGLVCLLVFAATSVAVAGELKVGDNAPNFALTDQEGKSQALTQLLKDGNVAIVFHRSASW